MSVKPMRRKSKKMKKALQTLMLLSIILTACAPQTRATTPAVLPTASGTVPEATVTAIPVAADTAVVTVQPPDPTATPSPSPTAIACVKGTPEIVGNTKIFWSCTESDQDRDIIRRYIAFAQSFAPEDVTLEAVVTVTTDGDAGGVTDPGKTSLGIPARWWWHEKIVQKHLVVLHEMHHLVQYELSHGVKAPVWFMEGGAQSFATRELLSLGETPIDRSGELPFCTAALNDLVYANVNSGKLEEDCIYIEGAAAVDLLIGYGGTDRYYEVFRQFHRLGNFKSAFNKAFSGVLTYDQFMTDFTSYQNSGYKNIPPLAD
jgi:hypothetical protein